MRNNHCIARPLSNRRMQKNLTGFICNAGTDFLDVKTRQGRIVTVLRSQIKNIEWIDPDCGPCGDSSGDCHCHPHSNCGCEWESSDSSDWCSEMVCESGFESESSSRCFQNHSSCCCNACGIPVCNDRFQLRLAGLTDQLNFQFFQFSGCEVSIELQ